MELQWITSKKRIIATLTTIFFSHFINLSSYIIPPARYANDKRQFNATKFSGQLRNSIIAPVRVVSKPITVSWQTSNLHTQPCSPPHLVTHRILITARNVAAMIIAKRKFFCSSSRDQEVIVFSLLLLRARTAKTFFLLHSACTYTRQLQGYRVFSFGSCRCCCCLFFRCCIGCRK